MNSAGQENLKLGEIQSFKMRLTVIRLQSLMLSKPNVNQYREILKWFSNWCSYQNGLSAIFPIKMRVYLRQCSNCMVLADFALDLIDSNMCLYLCIYNTTSWLFNSMVSGWILCTLHVKDRQQYQFKHETLQKKKYLLSEMKSNVIYLLFKIFDSESTAWCHKWDNFHVLGTIFQSRHVRERAQLCGEPFVQVNF